VLLEADAVVFFGSIRWGQTNAVLQRLIERLTWLENRHTTLGESNVLKNIDAGMILLGHNWNGSNVVATQQSVLKFFGFNTPKALSWNWQYTSNTKDETEQSYIDSSAVFHEVFVEKSVS
jgi:multimeric flavodoxin WrbA